MSSLSGMTGFARTSGASQGVEWTWEARSVNGKTLDVRLRIPPEFSGLDAPIRSIFRKTFKRGNIQLSLSLKSGEGEVNYSLNTPLIDMLIKTAKARGDNVNLDQIYLVPGVVMPSGESRSKNDHERLESALTDSARQLAERLKIARDGEGAALLPLLNGAISRINTLVNEAEALAASQPENLRASLSSRLMELLEQDLPEERLTQEAAILALKADVREETDRLKAHCAQANEHLGKGSPIGRKLDFLCQEFNREVNTLCSKSADIDLTRIGLELKSVVEQFREQAANVE